MQRTINHTGRRKIARNEVRISLNEEPDKPPQFDIDFALNSTNLPGDAAVFVEAYHRNTLQRFSFGIVSQLHPPAERVLDQLDLSGPILFRVHIVDESAHLGRLVASVEGLKPQGDEVAENRASMMTLKSRPLDQQTWKVNIPDDGKPELVINNAIPDALGQLKNNPMFQALILPAALRQVLIHYLWVNEFEECTIQEQWLNFAQLLHSERPHTADVSEIMNWVDEVVERFSQRFELCEMLKLKMEEAR